MIYHSNEIKHIGKVAEVLSAIYQLDREKIYDISIKPHKQKRSLDQNALMWKVINEIGNAMRLSKESVYEELLFKYGQVSSIQVANYVPIKKFFKYARFNRHIDANTDLYLIAMGTSEMNTKQMSIMIDGLLQDADALGIEILTESERNLIYEN